MDYTLKEIKRKFVYIFFMPRARGDSPTCRRRRSC